MCQAPLSTISAFLTVASPWLWFAIGLAVILGLAVLFRRRKIRLRLELDIDD